MYCLLLFGVLSWYFFVYRSGTLFLLMPPVIQVLVLLDLLVLILLRSDLGRSLVLILLCRCR